MERLPADIFENLVNVVDGDDDEETASSGVLLQRRICNKLKSFPRKIAGRTKQKNIKQVGDFLKISEVDLVHGLDPLLTFGTCGVVAVRRVRPYFVFGLVHFAMTHTSPYILECFAAECRELRRRICELCAAKSFTLLSLIRQQAETHDALGVVQGSHAASQCFIPSGIPSLDNQLKGGFRVGSVTEIFGRAGSGKTQLAMQICVETAKRGLAAAFIETEGKFSLTRLNEMALVRNEQANYDQTATAVSWASQSGRVPSQESHQGAMETLSRILLYSATDVDALRAAISAVEIEACTRTDRDENVLTPESPMGVIVLDSIAAPARRDFGKGEVAARAQSLMQFAKSLKRLAEDLKLAVVVINQIGGTAFRQGKTDKEEEILDTAGALGNSWHHCASTRLLVECKTPSDASSVGRTRQITVTKSSILKRGSTALVRLGRNGFEDPS